MNRSLLIGIVIGMAGVWAYHHFVGQLPGGKN